MARWNFIVDFEADVHAPWREGRLDHVPPESESSRAVELVLGPFEPCDRVVWVSEADANMETFAAEAGLFPSKSQARAAGFSGPVPGGFGFWGTDTGAFFVWNPHPVGTPTISRKRNLTHRWYDWLDTMRATGVSGPWDNPTLRRSVDR